MFLKNMNIGNLMKQVYYGEENSLNSICLGLIGFRLSFSGKPIGNEILSSELINQLIAEFNEYIFSETTGNLIIISTGHSFYLVEPHFLLREGILPEELWGEWTDMSYGIKDTCADVYQTLVRIAKKHNLKIYAGSHQINCSLGGSYLIQFGYMSKNLIFKWDLRWKTGEWLFIEFKPSLATTNDDRKIPTLTEYFVCKPLLNQ